VVDLTETTNKENHQQKIISYERDRLLVVSSADARPGVPLAPRLPLALGLPLEPGLYLARLKLELGMP
jgi:hypothetical protein